MQLYDEAEPKYKEITVTADHKGGNYGGKNKSKFKSTRGKIMNFITM